jgi:hypothetical protein
VHLVVRLLDQLLLLHRGALPPAGLMRLGGLCDDLEGGGTTDG